MRVCFLLLVLPQAIVNQRRSALERTVSGLPTAILFALRSGLEEYATSLTPGRLYTRSGGCAVGVMLRRIFPGAFCQSAPTFWLRSKLRRSIRDDFSALAREEVRLSHIEIIFDNSVRDLTNRFTFEKGAASEVVGRWIVSEINSELARRFASTPASLAGRSLSHAY